MTRKDRLGFISRVAPWAQFSQEKHGVPASVTIAQAILESSDSKGNWGQSLLARKYNNFFGIKDSRLSDEGYVELRTLEYEGLRRKEVAARFEAFRSPGRSFEAHARLLSSLPRYAKAMADADDPLVFAARLQECGYSTDPEYAKKLASLITAYKLAQYDAPKGKVQRA